MSRTVPLPQLARDLGEAAQLRRREPADRQRPPRYSKARAGVCAMDADMAVLQHGPARLARRLAARRAA